MKLPALSIKSRLTAGVLVLVVLALGSVLLVTDAKTTALAREDARAYAQALAGRVAAGLDDQVGEAMDVARELRTTMVAMSTSGGERRETANEVLHGALVEHPVLTATWAEWVRDGFGGPDERYAGDENRYGQYMPYWYRSGDEIAYSGTYEAGGDWWKIPRRTGQEKLLEPYLYRVDGERVLMTTATVPMYVGERFVGVAGTDLSLATLQASVREIHPLGSGYAELVTGDGLLVAGPSSAELGAPVSGPVGLSVQQAIEGGSTVVVNRDDPVLGGAALQVAVPLELGAQDTWAVLVSIPESRILARAHQLRSSLLVVSLVAIALIALFVSGLVWVVARSMVRPLRTSVEVLRKVAEGDLTQRIDVRTATRSGRWPRP